MNASIDPSLGETSPESIQNRVLRVIATSRRLPLESITPESTFEQLGIDSLDRINLLFDLENEFDISIDDEQAKTIANIPQMVTGIQQLLQAKTA
jgi:acyl carrier protein